eukprot:jgi/Hompol1/423/HPOL_000140-RA
MQQAIDAIDAAIRAADTPQLQLRLLRDAAPLLRSAMASSSSSASNSASTSTLWTAVQRCARFLFYAPAGAGPERALRPALLTLLHSALGLQPVADQTALRIELERLWTEFLQSTQETISASTSSDPGQDQDPDPTQFIALTETARQLTAVIIALLDSPQLGHALVQAHSIETLVLMHRALTEIQRVVAAAAAARFSPDEATITAMHHLLQASIAVVSKISGVVASLDLAFFNDFLRITMDLVAQDFATLENRTLAGLLAATLVVQRTPERVPAWLLHAIHVKSQHSLAEPYNRTWTEDESLLLLNGFLNVFPPEILSIAIPDPDIELTTPQRSSDSLITAISSHIDKTIKSSNEPKMHVLAFGTIARIFGVLKGLAKSNQLEQHIPSCITMINLSFQALLDRWEDPLATIQNKAKYDLLSIIMHEAPIRNHVIMQTDILSKSFPNLSNYMLSASVVHCINQALIFELRVKSDGWVAPVISGMISDDASVRKLIGEKILPKLAKTNPSSLKTIVEALHIAPYKQHPLGLYARVSVWKAISGSGPAMSALGEDQRIQETLERAIAHPDTSLRFDALELLTSASRAAQDVEPSVLKTLQHFLETNLCVQTSEARQRLLGQMHKFFERLKRALYANIRQLANKPPNPTGAWLETEAALGNGISSKEAFIKWLKNFAVRLLLSIESFGFT